MAVGVISPVRKQEPRQQVVQEKDTLDKILQGLQLAQTAFGIASNIQGIRQKQQAIETAAEQQKLVPEQLAALQASNRIKGLQEQSAQLALEKAQDARSLQTGELPGGEAQLKRLQASGQVLPEGQMPSKGQQGLYQTMLGRVAVPRPEAGKTEPEYREVKLFKKIPQEELDKKASLALKKQQLEQSKVLTALNEIKLNNARLVKKSGSPKFEKLTQTAREDAGRLGNSLYNVNIMEQIILKGGGPRYATADVPLVGKFMSETSYETAANFAAEEIGRLQSQGAITKDEIITFKDKLMPRAGDVKEVQLQKIQRMKDFIGNKLAVFDLNQNDLIAQKIKIVPTDQDIGKILPGYFERSFNAIAGENVMGRKIDFAISVMDQYIKGSDQNKKGK